MIRFMVWRAVALCGVLSSLASCTIQQEALVVTGTKSEAARSIPIRSGGFYHLPVVGDLVVDSLRVKELTRFDGKYGSTRSAKRIALAKLMENSGADVIVDPRYEMQKSEGDLEISVSGFPGRYANFHSADLGEIEVLRQSSGLVSLPVMYDEEVVSITGTEYQQEVKSKPVLLVAVLGAVAMILALAGP